MTQSIQALAAQWANAVACQNLEQIMAFYADEIIAYDAVAQLQFNGKTSYKAHWKKCMEICA